MIREDRLLLLEDGLRRLGEQSDKHPCEQYLQYLDLLAEWGQSYNLTAIRNPDDMISYLLLDNIAILPYVRGDACIDIGSGAGLPGLILAMARPEQRWVLVDANSKKARFMRHVQLTLGLQNVDVMQQRIERYQPGSYFTTAVCRAYSSLYSFYETTRRLVSEGSRIIAMKGELPLQELQELDHAGIGYAIVKLDIPGLEKQRHLVLMDI